MAEWQKEGSVSQKKYVNVLTGLILQAGLCVLTTFDGLGVAVAEDWKGQDYLVAEMNEETQALEKMLKGSLKEGA